MTFNLEDLHREIANIAYVAADVALTADNHHRLHQTFDICEEANIERINNLLFLAAAEVLQVMHNSECRMQNADSMHDAQCIMLNSDPSLTNHECGANEVSTTESCPTAADQRPKTADQRPILLHELIREFLVCRALHGWLSVTLPESAAIWHDRAEMLLARLRSISAGCTAPLTRRLSPF